MDEAERCHALAYIAYGKLLAHGTIQEVIDASGLATFEVEGEDAMGAAEKLRGKAGVEMVAPFGNTLHVCGTDRASLEASVREVAGEASMTVREVEPSLEDVFIHLMRDLGTAARRHPGPGQHHSGAGSVRGPTTH
jgi:ABC-2 type transport system ATP-binding protein